MKILYFSWGELTKTDCIKNLCKMAEVSVIEYPIKKMTNEKEVQDLVEKAYTASSFEYLFSFDFIPVLAKFSYFHKIPYISYIYDSPHQTLRNEWAYSPYNYFFLFDSIQADDLIQKGFGHVYYLPLPIDKERMEELSSTPISYENDIAFMGNLYTDSNDFFQQIKGIKPETRKRLDACIKEQQKEPGVEIIEQELDDVTMEELTSLVSFDFSNDYHLTQEELIRYSLYRTCTAKERTDLVCKIAERFPLALYTYSDTMTLKGKTNIFLHGPLDYMTTMPQTFRNSKINLNFTLRNIQSGIPLRCIDVLGAGGFLITNYQKDMEKHFENRKDLVWYHTPEEMLELIDYYLKNDKERETIALNGQKKVLSLFSYEKQLTTIFGIVDENPVVERGENDIPISVCLIGKNEEKHVEACLKPWHDLGFEIIVADTGSTDRTMELSRKYTNNVFYHPWRNHFAEVRNNAAMWARNPYVLFIDFDEYLVDIDLEEVIKSCNPYSIGFINCQTPNSNGLKDQVMVESMARLICKDVYRYEGRVHEQPCRIDGSKEVNCVQIPITLNHKGYIDAADLGEKMLRNLKLLFLDLKERGENPYTYFHIGRSYSMLGDLDHAIEYYNLALSMEVNPDQQYVQDLVEAYGYCLLQKGEIEEALQLENIYEEFSNRADFVFLMGLIYMNATLFENAIVQFEKAATIDNFVTIGMNSFLAWYNAGVVCEVCGLVKEALDYYLKCGDYEPALKRIEEIGCTISCQK